MARGFVIWDVPVGKSRRFLSNAGKLTDWLLGGWQINGILDASSGYPFSVFSGFHTFTFYDDRTNVASLGGDQQPRRLQRHQPGHRQGHEDRDRRGLPLGGGARAVLGAAAGRCRRRAQHVHRPGLLPVRPWALQELPINDRRRVELRMEVFNLFDSVNFSQPNATLTAGAFGTINGTRVPPRTIQLGAKLYF